jgi:thiol-disulfide isomerase/thioredoxin
MSKHWIRIVLGATLLAVAAAPVSGQAARALCAPNAKAANLNFTLKDLKGTDVSLSAYQGKVILLDFWATWCGPCKVEIPWFIEFYAKYRAQGLQVVGVDIDDPIPALTQYVQKMNMNYPVLIGQGREDLLKAYGPMPGLPTTFIIGRDGKVCTSHTGLGEKATFEQTIKALL